MYFHMIEKCSIKISFGTWNTFSINVNTSVLNAVMTMIVCHQVTIVLSRPATVNTSGSTRNHYLNVTLSGDASSTGDIAIM